MSLDRTSAEEIAALIKQSSELCDASLKVVKSNEGLGQLQVFARLAGSFLGHSYANLLAPIWEQHPELEPQEMKEPYKEPVPSLTPESMVTIAAFLKQATSSLVRINHLLQSQHASLVLPFGGLPEIERSVANIEEFLAKPRFHDEEPLS